MKESELLTEIETAKRKMMKRIYFRLVDPRYTLPSEDEWDEYITALRNPQVEQVTESVEETVDNSIE